jgi:hypothetical protein
MRKSIVLTSGGVVRGSCGRMPEPCRCEVQKKHAHSERDLGHQESRQSVANPYALDHCSS